MRSNNYFSFKTTDCEFEYDNDDVDDIIPENKKRSTKETIIRFLKAQIKKFQSDAQAAQIEMKKKVPKIFL